MASLDTLSTFGSELTAEQIDDVDGGAVLVTAAIIGLAVFDVALWSYILSN